MSDSEFADALMDRLANSLVGRALQTSYPDNPDVDITTLGKPGRLHLQTDTSNYYDDLEQADQQGLTHVDDKLEDSQLEQVLGLHGGMAKKVTMAKAKKAPMKSKTAVVLSLIGGKKAPMATSKP